MKTEIILLIFIILFLNSCSYNLSETTIKSSTWNIFYTWIMPNKTQKNTVDNTKNNIQNNTEKEENKEIKIQDIFWNDNSITKFVSAKVGFDDKEYIPGNLVSISSANIIDNKIWQVLRVEAKNTLDNMATDFYASFWKKLVVVSAYRSYLDQKKIKDNGCPDNFCAKAWFSEHQTWLAVDFFEATNKDQFLSNSDYKKYFEWLNENAFKYGFHNSYQKWLEVDTYEIEPWHWRFLWADLATKLKQNNLTYAEYIKNEEIKNKKK